MKKLFDKYKTLPDPVRASLWFIVSGFLQKGISFLTTPVFTRLMSEEAYGQYSAYHSWLNIFSVAVSLNLAAGVYTRGLVKNEDKADAFSSAMVSLSTVCISIGFLICMVFKNVISDLTGISGFLLVVMFAEIWSTAVFQFWSNKQRVNYKYKGLVLLTLVYVLLSQLVPIVIIYLNTDGDQAFIRAASVAFTGVVLFTPLFLSFIRKDKRLFNREYWKYALAFNLPLVPHYLSQIVLNESDRIMIKSLCGADFTGYYSVAYSLAMVMLVFSNSISGVMNPWIYKSIKSDSYQRIGRISYSVLAVIALINSVLVTVAPEALSFIAPENYREALWVIPPVTASVYFMFLYNLFATFEYYYEKTHYVMLSSVLSAAANIILNYLFIPKYGFVAAGYTTLICHAAVSLLHYAFMVRTCRKHIGKTKIYNAGIIFAIGAAFVLYCGFMMALYPYAAVRYCTLVILGVACFVMRKKLINIFTELKK